MFSVQIHRLDSVICHSRMSNQRGFFGLAMAANIFANLMVLTFLLSSLLAASWTGLSCHWTYLKIVAYSLRLSCILSKRILRILFGCSYRSQYCKAFYFKLVFSMREVQIVKVDSVRTSLIDFGLKKRNSCLSIVKMN